MKVSDGGLPGLLLVEPRRFPDERGWFFESWVEQRYRDAGVGPRFVQDNVSRSRRGVVRGLHFQHPGDQGKLISVLNGAAFDVAVDVRVGSPTFGKWTAQELSADNQRQFWIPPGFAHGFQALADDTVMLYKCTDAWQPSCERTVRYDDPALAIAWPLAGMIVSAKDAAGLLLADLPKEHLPGY